MPFVGQAVVKLVSDRLVRVTGVSLNAEGGAGTIALFEKTAPAPDVRLPDDFKPRNYDLPDVEGGVVTLQDSVQCWFVYTNPGTVVPSISVVKTGSTPQDFLVTLTNNTQQEGGNSGNLEIYVGFH